MLWSGRPMANASPRAATITRCKCGKGSRVEKQAAEKLSIAWIRERFATTQMKGEKFSLSFPFSCSTFHRLDGGGAGSLHILQKCALARFMCLQGHNWSSSDPLVGMACIVDN